MGHPIVGNNTPFVAEPLFLLDAAGRNVCAVVVKGTYHIAAEGRCVLEEKQLPLVLEPVPRGDPATSSLELDT
jgi:hypothetical protein